MHKQNRFTGYFLLALLVMSIVIGMMVLARYYDEEDIIDTPVVAVEPVEAEPLPVHTMAPIATPEPTPEPLQEVMYYTDAEVIQVAKFLWQEARGIASDTEVACVAWVPCNRVDGEYGDTISSIWGPHIYYDENAPIDGRMVYIASDVLERWNTEKDFGHCEGRVLPPDYYWYLGDGRRNNFRNVFNDYENVWDYSLPLPYDS